MDTRSTVKTTYAFAWMGDELKRSRYGYNAGNTVTSERGQPNVRRPRSPNEFSLTKTTLDFEPGRYVRNSDHVHVSGRSLALVGLVDMYSGAPPLSPLYSSAKGAAAAIAIQQAYKNASEPYFRELHQMGELAETLAALKSPMSGLRKLNSTLASVVLGGKKVPKGIIKEASGAYLEHIYGTAPLIGTAATYGQTIGRILDKSMPEWKISRGRSEQTYVDTEDRPVYWSAWVSGYTRPIWDKCWLNYSITEKVQERAGAGIIVNNPRLRNSYTSLASIAQEGWELLPLSFLFNMFVDLSSLLAECRPVAGQMMGSWVTEVVTHQVRYELQSVLGHTTDTPAAVTVSKNTVNRRIGLTRTGKLHLGPGLNSFGKVLSTLALGISRTK